MAESLRFILGSAFTLFALNDLFTVSNLFFMKIPSNVTKMTTW